MSKFYGYGFGLLLLFLLIFPQENILYSLVPVAITIFGYISLWINTANMKSDQNANKYYPTNEYASIFIGVPYAFAMAYGIYSYNIVD